MCKVNQEPKKSKPVLNYQILCLFQQERKEKHAGD